MEFEEVLKCFIKACNEKNAEDIYRFTFRETKILWPKGTGYNDNFRRLFESADERGSNLNIVRRTGLPQVLEERHELSQNMPFITICPQCPGELRWYMLNHSLKELLNKIIEEYEVDDDRIYLTGNSMGGNGVWSLASEYPGRFAAIAPICGRTDYVKTSRLKRIPTWVFHGKEDDVIPISFSREIVNKLKKDNKNIKLTVYPDAKHDCWTETYNNPRLYKWFLSHKDSTP